MSEFHRFLHQMINILEKHYKKILSCFDVYEVLFLLCPQRKFIKIELETYHSNEKHGNTIYV